MKLKPYSEYKDSGIQWIGRIPEGWEVHRLKFLLSSLESGSRETGGGNQLDEGIFSLGGEHINWNGTLNLENPKLISEEYYNLMNQGKLKINDVLLVKDGATIGKTAFFRKKEFEKMTVNEHVFLMRSNKRIYPKLLYYLICGDSGFKQIKLTEVGSAQGGINQDFIAKIYFSIPGDKQDQTAIANFLDKETSRIDSLIEKDKRLIELLKEKRTALINHAVTKGIDPNVKMKDSGINWIGEIPVGWEIRKVSRSFDIIGSGTTPKSQEASYYDKGDIPWIITGDLNDSLLKEPSKKITKETLINYSVLKMYPKNSLIIAMYGATIGKIALLNMEACTNQACCVLAKSRIFETKYVFYWFIANKKNIISYSYGGGQPNISQDVVKTLKIPLPPRSEQQKIVRYLDKAVVKIDKTIQKIEEKIKLLEEYKKSLIHHLVTGKIDVRGPGI